MVESEKVSLECITTQSILLNNGCMLINFPANRWPTAVYVSHMDIHKICNHGEHTLSTFQYMEIIIPLLKLAKQSNEGKS